MPRVPNDDLGSLVGAVVPPKVKKVAVCKCGDEKDKCTVCQEGYLEMTLSGKVPHFADREVKMKRVAVCKCEEEKEICATCNEGFVQMLKRGESPHFKLVEENQTSSGNNEPPPPAPLLPKGWT